MSEVCRHTDAIYGGSFSNPRFKLGAFARGHELGRYFLVKVKNDKVCFARWSDQFARHDAIANVLNRHSRNTFKLEEIVNLEGAAGSKDVFPSMRQALDTYGALSLPARLVKPVLWTEHPTKFESQGVPLQSLVSRGEFTTPGCFICGGEFGKNHSLAGYVKSEAAFESISSMFNGRGIAGGMVGLDYNENATDLFQRSDQKQRFPVFIGACKNHVKILQSLLEHTFSEPKNVTREKIELIIAFGGRVNVEWAKAEVENKLRTGKPYQELFRVF